MSRTALLKEKQELEGEIEDIDIIFTIRGLSKKCKAEFAKRQERLKGRLYKVEKMAREDGGVTYD